MQSTSTSTSTTCMHKDRDQNRFGGTTNIVYRISYFEDAYCNLEDSLVRETSNCAKKKSGRKSKESIEKQYR